MISEKLQKVRQFESDYLKNVDESKRPSFHLTGSVGWINDPNGFSLYKDEYHLFYQSHPYTRSWGPMHWGHVKTNDFVRWERLDTAMAPDQPYDEEGCFSGNAMTLDDGRHLLMYTGVSQGNGYLLQQQCIALGDGKEYQKYENNPVVRTSDLPDFVDIRDFRDPKIWKQDGKYYMAAGVRTFNDGGAVLLYSSPDILHWTYEGVLDSSKGQYGRMWECPDYFELDGKQVLVISPCEMSSVGLEFHPGHNTAALIGHCEGSVGNFRRESIHSLDYGLDFYAPQTLLSKDGRRIMIAWMQNWVYQMCRPEGIDFFGQMILPRELWIENGRIYQKPVREIEAFRKNHVWYNNVYLRGETSLSNISGRCIDLTIRIRPVHRDSYQKFTVNVAMDGENRTSFRYNPLKQTVRVDRSRSGFPYDIVNTREFFVSNNDGNIEFRVIMDKYSIELFINGGEQAASSVIYTKLSADSISFVSEGEVFMDLDKYDLVIE